MTVDPLRRLAVIWFLVAAVVLLFMVCRPGASRQPIEATPTLPVVVLPTQPSTATPAPTVTPRESVLVPTRAPTLTFTPLPTRTPRPVLPPVQRG